MKRQLSCYRRQVICFNLFYLLKYQFSSEWFTHRSWNFSAVIHCNWVPVLVLVTVGELGPANIPVWVKLPLISWCTMNNILHFFSFYCRFVGFVVVNILFDQDQKSQRSPQRLPQSHRPFFERGRFSSRFWDGSPKLVVGIWDQRRS